MQDIPRIINAAGKLTALGGSAQSGPVAMAMAKAASKHVDLKTLRQAAGDHVATLTGAEAACITTGAAAGIAISVAALITGNNLMKVQQLPYADDEYHIFLQAGHAVNFGASIEQMIRVGGGLPWIIGDTNSVSERQLAETLETATSHCGFLYVKSHHCVQENMISLDQCIALCHQAEVPVIVDAAAEEDLQLYISAGADLVTYSGGKAFSGPTVGFIAGRKDLIESCELQFRGIARSMKVGKEQIFGLLKALEEYQDLDPEERSSNLKQQNESIISALSDVVHFKAYLKPDEAGREFDRVAISAATEQFSIRDLVQFLSEGKPGIRTRNHHLDQGYLLIDPRELMNGDPELIVKRLLQFSP
jgi:D-glucosaminate-6-phosphate ammonia-lyase